MTERVKKAASSREPATRSKTYETLIKNLPAGVYRSTPEGKIIAMNPALVRTLGFPDASELMKSNTRSFYLSEQDRTRHFRNLARRGAAVAEYRLRRRDGKLIWVRDFAMARKGNGGRILYTDGVIHDITRERQTEARLKRALKKLAEANVERQEMIRQLKKVTITDDLTGLYNRRGFNVIARQHLLVADRRKSLTYLLYLDLDHLKRVNDTFGHRIGDEALIALAEILRATFRLSDIKARMGGDEFAVFPIDSNEEGVNSAIGRLSGALDEFNASGKAPFRLSVSTGISCYDPASPSSIEDLLSRADNLMYEEKRRKKNGGKS
ncbi:MAG: GGDEF domain-containing protein [Candidatus Aminicenantes bacterium]|nr:GGDEF domain-containing protein [Candidatus Aminicenantes bacterium]